MRIRLFTVAVLATLSVAGGNASATTARVSQGEAQAILQSFGNAGWAILRHNGGVAAGAPADGLDGSLATIRPIGVFNDNHYCALDWHVVVLSVFDGGDASYTAQDFAAFRSQVSMSFTLDGLPLATGQTASKRSLRDLTAFGITTSYYFSQGRVLAPEELAVGTHTLTTVLTDSEGTDLLGISFVVDAPGTGACL